MTATSFAVVPDQLAAEADRLDSAADRIRDLREHPGPLRGRAQDCGDAELASALVGFGSAWQEGLRAVGAEATRWAVLLRTARDVYGQVESAVTSLVPTRLPG